MTAGRCAARTFQRLGAVVAGIVMGMLALPVGASAQQGGPTQLEASDMTLFAGVRLAGLWEMPAGQMAAEKGSQARVREVGAAIAEQHVELEHRVVHQAVAMRGGLDAHAGKRAAQWSSVSA